MHIKASESVIDLHLCLSAIGALKDASLMCANVDGLRIVRIRGHSHNVQMSVLNRDRSLLPRSAPVFASEKTCVGTQEERPAFRVHYQRVYVLKAGTTRLYAPLGREHPRREQGQEDGYCERAHNHEEVMASHLSPPLSFGFSCPVFIMARIMKYIPRGHARATATGRSPPAAPNTVPPPARRKPRARRGTPQQRAFPR